MAKQQYTIPMGIDLNPAIADLNQTLDTMDKVEKGAKDAGKVLEDSFKKAGTEAEKAEKKMQEFNAGLEKAKQQGRDVGKELATAFTIRGQGKDFEKSMDNFKKKMQEIANTKVVVDVDDSKLKLLDAAIASGADELEIMQQQIALVKQALETLDPNSEEFEQLAQAVAYTEAVFESFETEVQNAVKNNQSLHATFEEVYGDLQPLSTRLGELEDRLYEMALANQQGTKEFKAIQAEAIKYRQTIQQVDAAIDTFARRSAMLDIMVESATALTGAFTAVQGVTALLGEENEELEAALLKVNGAMAVLQGLQAVAQALNKESALSAILYRNSTVSLTVALQGQTLATQASIIATRALGIALKAIGIGVIVALLVLLYENWDKVTKAINSVLPAGLSAGKMFDRLKSIVVGVGNAVFQFLITPIKTFIALATGDFQGAFKAMQNGMNLHKNFMSEYNAQELRNQKEHQRKMEEAQVTSLERDLQRRKNRGEDVAKEEIALQKRRLAIYEQGEKEYQENLTKLEDMEDSHYKAKKDKAEQDAKEAKRIAEQAAKEAAQRSKEQNEQLIKFARDLQDAKINAMEEGYDKERAEIEAQYQNAKDDLEKEKALTVEAEKIKTQLLVALRIDRNAQLKKVDEEEQKEYVELLVNSQQIMADLMKEGMARDLELLKVDHEIRYAEITEQYKDDQELRDQLLNATSAYINRERQRIQNEYFEKEIEEQEQRQLAMIELSSKYAARNEKSERAKQIAILETKIEFAQKALDLLVSSGLAEDDIKIVQAKATIAKLKQELGDEVRKNDGQGFDFMDFIGLGGLSGDQQKKVKEAGKQIMDNMREITDFIVGQYDRQIEKRQENIDRMQDEIDDLEGMLEDEKALQEAGLANNVALIQQQLAAKQAEKDEEIRQQEELIKKKQNIQRGQMAVDTTVQLVNMITASTEIFKSLSGIPFVGVPLAIGLIATMFGAFIGAKIKAAQAIKDGGAQQFGKGGTIDGPSHAGGGVKYYSADGRNIELEGGEKVIRRSRSHKYGTIADALNDPNFPAHALNEAELYGFLAELGITMGEDSTRDEVKAIRDGKVVVNTNSNPYGKEMNDNLRILAKAEKGRVSSWEDDIYFYKKKGNVVTKRKKQKV